MKNLKTFSLGLALAALAASLCSPLVAQTEVTPTPSPTTVPSGGSTLSHWDKSFLKKAAKAGSKEIAVSQAVMDHLTNPQVKSFAQKMVTDHTQVNSDLTSLAASKGVDLPTADASLTDEWSKKTDDVDRKYIDEMVSDHEEAVKLFEKASKSNDPDISSFAQKTLPTLQMHLSMARDLKNTLK